MTLEIHIDPRPIRAAVESHPKLRKMRRVLEDRFGATPARARALAEDVLMGAVQRFGARYLDAMVARMTHLFELRTRAAGIVERVIGREALSASAAAGELKGIFADLRTDMEAVTDPATFARKTPLKADPDIEKDVDRAFGEYEARKPGKAAKARALPTGRHVERVDVLATQFRKMSKPRRASMARAAELAPHELWLACSAESEASLGARIKALRERAAAKGLGRREIDQLEAAVREMSLERARSQRLPDTAEGVMRARALDRLPADLRRFVEGDRAMEEFAAHNPQALADFFAQSGAKSKTALRRYIRQRMVTHMRGLLGEFTAVFQLGDRLVFLKAADYDVTLPGTDFVGVARDGRVWLIDNKAMSATELASVGALMRNLPGNIADDVRDFKGTLGLAKDPLVGDAVRRLDAARKDIADRTRGMSAERVGSAAVQKRIDAICDAHRLDRVVTNAGGSISGLSDGLTRAGILLEDLNKIADEDDPGTGARHYPLPKGGSPAAKPRGR